MIYLSIKIDKINAKIKNEKYVQANNTHFNQSNVKIRAFSLIPLMNDNFCRVDYCGIGVGEVGSTYLDRNVSNKEAEIIEGMLINEDIVRIVLEHHGRDRWCLLTKLRTKECVPLDTVCSCDDP